MARSGQARVLVLELLAGAPGEGWYDRVVKLPNYFGVVSQAVAAWAEDLGCQVVYRTYTGNESVRDLLDGTWDVAFLSSYTRAALAAYALSHQLRGLGTVTAFGGPHATAYPEDSRLHFDYVLGFTDRSMVSQVVEERRPAGMGPGRWLSARRHPTSLPGLRRRQRFLDAALAKTRFLHVVPVIASLGCPFECDFCSDARVDHQSLPIEAVADDVRFAGEHYPGSLLFWQDPTFGVHWEPLLAAIEEASRGAKVRFGAESTISILSHRRVERLASARFVALLPGIESWFGYGSKLGMGRLGGADRVREAARRVNEILRSIPYLQVNFVFGLDDEPTPEAFELTADFVRAAPGAWPSLNLATAWGVSSPLSERLGREGRVLPIPFPLLDQKHCSNVVRATGPSPADLFRNLLRLQETAFGVTAAFRRSVAARGWGPRFVNAFRARGSEMRHRMAWYRRMLSWLESDRDFRRFFEGERVPVPPALRAQALRRISPFADLLPPRVASELRTGIVSRDSAELRGSAAEAALRT